MPPIVLFILLLMLAFAVAFYFLRPTKTETAVQHHLQEIQVSREEGVGGTTILREEGYSSNPGVSDIVRQVPGAMGTLNLIRQSGQNWAVSRLMAISLWATAVASWMVSQFAPGLVIPVAAGIVAGASPYIYLYILREQRFKRCDKLLPEAIDLMARGLRAGH